MQSTDHKPPESVSLDLLYEIFNKLNLIDLYNIIKINRYFNQVINKNNKYWKGRYLQYLNLFLRIT